jgi:hypothetical protein
MTEEEPAVVPAKVSGNSDPKFYTEADIQQAREQEKSKLYRRLETMQETVTRLEAERQERVDAEAARQKEIDDQARIRREEEMSAKDLIAQKEAEWRAEQADLRAQIEQERALRERESQFAELMEARQQVLAQYQDKVAPELIDLIGGDTVEEMVQSAEDMATRTQRILEQTQQAMQQTRQQIPTARVTVPVSSGPDDEGAVRQYTPDDIRNMSMSDYAKHRQRLLGRGAGGPKNRGLFG